MANTRWFDRGSNPPTTGAVARQMIRGLRLAASSAQENDHEKSNPALAAATEARTGRCGRIILIAIMPAVGVTAFGMGVRRDGPSRRIPASMVAASSTRDDARRHGARPDGFREKGGLDLASRPPVANAADLFLLLALGVRLRGVLVRRFGFFGRLSGLLFCTRMVVAAVLLGRRPMRLCGLIVKFGSLLVRVLRHRVSLLFGEAQTNVSRSRSFQRVAEEWPGAAETRNLGASRGNHDRHRRSTGPGRAVPLSYLSRSPMFLLRPNLRSINDRF
jgi:hypothetical protein